MFRRTVILLLACLSPISPFAPHINSVTTTRQNFGTNSIVRHEQFRQRRRYRFLRFSSNSMFSEDDDDEEEDDDDEEEDPYSQANPSEFSDDTTRIDWGGALGKLRERIEDQESGTSQQPSYALYRSMISQTPNEAIGKFVQGANPNVVASMSGAVSSLLGGLTNPSMGVETIVKASGEKIGSLCFQLQMTGYMFRNAEYVLALKDLMKIRGKATKDDYKRAFDRLDRDNSGYIESSEIEALLKDVYDDDKGPPAYEIQTFLQFFDSNRDGRISWEEFEKGLGVAGTDEKENNAEKTSNNDDHFLLPEYDEDGDDDYNLDGMLSAEPNVSGRIQVELKDGNVIEVEAKDYIRDLKREAEALKEALRREDGQQQNGQPQGGSLSSVMPPSSNQDENSGGIATYIASLGGDVKALTEGISPEVVDAMKMLVNYVIEGGPSKKKNKGDKNNEIEMEIPGTSLQQLALWQLVLGYRLREAEATGDYLKLLE